RDLGERIVTVKKPLVKGQHPMSALGHRLLAFEDPSDADPGLLVRLPYIAAITLNPPAAANSRTAWTAGHSMFESENGKFVCTAIKNWVRRDQEPSPFAADNAKVMSALPPKADIGGVGRFNWPWIGVHIRPE